VLLIFSDAYKQIVKALLVFTVNGSLVIESNHPSKSIEVFRIAPGVYYAKQNYSTG
jgi:hypothetical protein